MPETSEAKVVFSLMSDSPLAMLLARLIAKSERLRPQDSRHSVEYWCEDLFARSIRAADNYLDADSERRNKEAFNREIAKLVIPAPENIEAMAAYAQKVANLQRKFRIGGQKQEV